MTQKENPLKNDWVLEVSQLINDEGINPNFEDIRKMSIKCFRKLKKANPLKVLSWN